MIKSKSIKILECGKIQIQVHVHLWSFIGHVKDKEVYVKARSDQTSSPFYNPLSLCYAASGQFIALFLRTQRSPFVSANGRTLIDSILYMVSVVLLTRRVVSDNTGSVLL